MQPHFAIAPTVPAKAGWPSERTAKNGSQAGLAAIDALGSVVLVARDKEIFAEGDTAEYCYKVIAGAVRTLKQMPDGRRQISEFHMPGDLFGWEERDTHFLTAEAAADATLIRYPRKRIEAQASTDPALARKLLEMALDSLRNCHKQMLLLGRKSAQERIATFLLDMARRSRGDNDVIDLPMSRMDIADHLGLTLETVSRVLHRLHRDAAIKLASLHRVELTDRAAIEDMDGEG